MPAGPARRDFVLEAFRRDEIPAVRRMVQSAADGVAMFATAGIGQAMKICNTQ
jgi:peptidyl-tRNA hydrolase